MATQFWLQPVQGVAAQFLMGYFFLPGIIPLHSWLSVPGAASCPWLLGGFVRLREETRLGKPHALNNQGRVPLALGTFLAPPAGRTYNWGPPCEGARPFCLGRKSLARRKLGGRQARIPRTGTTPAQLLL